VGGGGERETCGCAAKPEHKQEKLVAGSVQLSKKGERKVKAIFQLEEERAKFSNQGSRSQKNVKVCVAKWETENSSYSHQEKKARIFPFGQEKKTIKTKKDGKEKKQETGEKKRDIVYKAERNE